MVIGRSRWKLAVLLLVGLALFSLSVSGSIAEAGTPPAVTVNATLVQTIRTSDWNPPSPDPSGITYWPAHDTLVVVDGEVEEMPIYRGANTWEASRQGVVQNLGTTMPYTREPVGIDIAYDPTSGHFFISDDNEKRVFQVAIGPDGTLGTNDDTIVGSFSTSRFGDNDPEGLTFGTIAGQRRLFIVDAAATDVYVLNPGVDGIFNGVSPEGDDTVTSFDVGRVGAGDPEGIEFNPAAGTLYLADRKRPYIFEITTNGTLVSQVNISFLNARNPSDVTLAPSSVEPGVMNLYVTERGVDNNDDPRENDGRIYEIALGGTPPPPPSPTPTQGPPPSPTPTNTPVPPSGNLLANAGFEQDSNPADGAPDGWSLDSRFTRSSEVAAEGSFSGKHAGSANASYIVHQRVEGISAGVAYTLLCQVNIPPTSDSFVYRFQIRWLNATNRSLKVDSLPAIKRATNGWTATTGTFVAPAGATRAEVRMKVKDLDSVIYLDGCQFGN